MIRALIIALSVSPACANDAQFQTQLNAARQGIGRFPQPWRPIEDRPVVSEMALLQTFKDADAAKKIAALRVLKYYPEYAAAQTAALKMLEEGVESDVSVRMEAVKTLSRFDGAAADRIFYIASGQKFEDSAVRAMALKTLYRRAGQDATIRFELMKAAAHGTDERIRRGAIWGLFQALSSDDLARFELLKLLDRRNAQPEGVRLEALRTLYGQISRAEVRDAVAAVEASADEPAALREAARLALSGPENPETFSFFHLGYWSNGRFIEPLDLE